MWSCVLCFEKLRDTEAVRTLRRKRRGEARAGRLRLLPARAAKGEDTMSEPQKQSGCVHAPPVCTRLAELVYFQHPKEPAVEIGGPLAPALWHILWVPWARPLPTVSSLAHMRHLVETAKGQS